MKKVIFVFLIFCFSLTIISCGVNWVSNKDDSTSGLFVSVGNSGTIIISSDGITWTFSTSGTSSILWGINYGNSTFVTVGDSGTILTSSDGTSWDERTSDVSSTLYGVTYGNSTFVTVGDNGTILTSSDGTTWTSRTSNTSKDLYGVTYGNNTFVTVGDSGTILTSSSGTRWTSRSGTSTLLNEVIYENSTFVTVVILEPSLPLRMEHPGIIGLLVQKTVLQDSLSETVHS